jgi:hypothetical protein
LAALSPPITPFYPRPVDKAIRQLELTLSRSMIRSAQTVGPPPCAGRREFLSTRAQPAGLIPGKAREGCHAAPEVFKGEQAIFESSVLQHFLARRFHDAILDILKDRFGKVPQDITKLLGAVINEKKLRKLNVLAAKCLDLATFRDALVS